MIYTVVWQESGPYDGVVGGREGGMYRTVKSGPTKFVYKGDVVKRAKNRNAMHVLNIKCH